jgi:phosphatidylserine/phosphatidylglycerophosphate/cardiolipin synthase-like enzyme
MANRGVRGRVVEAGSPNGLQGLIVHVFDVDGLVGEDGEDFLSGGVTDSAGAFEVTYEPSKYGSLEFEPDLVVRIFDAHMRLLHETSPVVEDVQAEFHVVSDVSLHPADHSGIHVTNAVRPPGDGEQPGVAQLRSQGNKVKLYVDNETAWIEFMAAVERASSFINVSQLYNEPKTMIARFDAAPVEGQKAKGKSIEQLFKDAATERKLTVRVVLNFPDDGADASNNALYQYTQGKVETYTETVEFFAGSPVQIRKFVHTFIGPMHAKVVVVDGTEAWLFGSPFNQNCFDAPPHRIEDARRGTLQAGASLFGVTYPFHDLSLRIVGPAVHDLDKTFEEIWNQAEAEAQAPAYTSAVGTPAATLPPDQDPSAWTEASLQVTRTFPGNRSGRFAIGETGVLESYQRAIAVATDFIYIEDQYLWCPDVLESLKCALRREDAPQIILVGNHRLDVPGYQEKQEANLKDFQAYAKQIGREDKLGMFTLWLHEAAEPKSKLIPLYVHTKLAIVDDKWATIGSANLDGNSLNVASTAPFLDSVLGIAQRFGAPVQHATNARSLQPPRNVEVNVALFNGIDGEPASSAVDMIRDAVWCDHLAVTPLPARPAGGWLALWKDAANGKHTGLQAKPPTVRAARPLPWRHSNKPRCYLKQLDVSRSELDLLTRFREFDLAKGKWVD